VSVKIKVEDEKGRARGKTWPVLKSSKKKEKKKEEGKGKASSNIILCLFPQTSYHHPLSPPSAPHDVPLSCHDSERRRRGNRMKMP
jgi:hypothetical protein